MCHVRDNFARKYGDMNFNLSVERLQKGHWKNPLFTLNIVSRGVEK